MADFFHISEAAAIGIHACILIAMEEGASLSAREVATRLGVSYDHTVRVMHRLRQEGILKSVRGPSGGFLLAEDPARVTALQVLEALDGKVEERHCLFMADKCRGCCVLFGDIRSRINRDARDSFARLTLTGLTEQMRKAAEADEDECYCVRAKSGAEAGFVGKCGPGDGETQPKREVS